VLAVGDQHNTKRWRTRVGGVSCRSVGQAVSVTARQLTKGVQSRVAAYCSALHHLPQDAEVLAFEAGCEEFCEREVDEVEWQGDRIYLHLRVRRDERRQR
jgi:hypothetical protein